jgi:hypothetical protein
MTTLFRRLQPAKKFRITLSCIAQLLKIPSHLIVRIQCWAYVVFVHRSDKGGQFLSYRRLRQWLNAISYAGAVGNRLPNSTLLHLATTTAIVERNRIRSHQAREAIWQRVSPISVKNQDKTREYSQEFEQL